MKKFVLLALITCISAVVFAQDDLLKMLGDAEKPKFEKVIATFKTTKLVNVQTNETVHRRVLDFRIAHRFGSVGAQYNGGFHNFYGLYSINDIRFAFEYGITDKLTIGISRAKQIENFEGLVKYRLLQQTTDNRIPIGISVFGNTAISAVKDYSEQKIYDVFSRRMAYSLQLSIVRKFSRKFSLTLNPMYVHRNFVSNANDFNDSFSLGAGFRYKLNKSISVVGDYIYNFNSFTRSQTTTIADGTTENYWDPIGLGIEIETGGHVFTVMFSNTPQLIESEMLTNASENPAKGGIKLSFNISRNFKL